jgi:hypothetical protein
LLGVLVDADEDEGDAAAMILGKAIRAVRQ